MSELNWKSRLDPCGYEWWTALVSDEPFLLYEIVGFMARDTAETVFQVRRTFIGDAEGREDAEDSEDALQGEQGYAKRFTSVDAAKQAAQEWENQR
jgi:hypothetical protein